MKFYGTVVGWKAQRPRISSWDRKENSATSMKSSAASVKSDFIGTGHFAIFVTPFIYSTILMLYYTGLL